MPFCPECGKSVGPLQKFCRNCGATLIEEELPAAVPPATVPGTQSCRTCGALLALDEKFCGDCGTKAGGAPAAAAPAPAAVLLYPAAPVPATSPTPVPAPAPAVAPVAAGQPSGLACSSCRTPMTPDMKFCGCCGAPAPAAAVTAASRAYIPPPPLFSGTPATGTLVCRVCGNPLKPGNKVCSRCFSKVTDSPGAPPPPPSVHIFPPPAAPAPGGYVCASCGSRVSGLEKFCGICGAIVVAARAPAAPPNPAAAGAPAGKFCGHCGGAISSTTKFCGSCGAVVNSFSR